VANEFVPVIEPDGVGALKPGHAGDEIGVGRLDYQMIVIAH
jgi:hypothetical protein